MANAVPTTLRLLDPRLSALIRQTSDPATLRRFASACARSALSATSLHDETLDRAVAHAETLGAQATNETDRLRQSVERIVERLDTDAFDAQDALDAGTGPREAYDSAFARARAATAVLRSLDPTPLVAAAEACYEAFHATGDADGLVAVARDALH